MPRQSLFDRYQIFAAASAISAHVTNVDTGWRQQDVKLFLEIFINWFEFSESFSELNIQNNQYARYLSNLAEQGYAREVRTENYPLYLLTRSGMIELLSRIVEKPHYVHKEHFYFALHFIKNYRIRVINTFKKGKKLLTASLRSELEELFDVESIIERQKNHINRELRKLENRINQQQELANLVSELAKEGKDFRQVVRAVDSRFPFAVTNFRRYGGMLPMGTEKQGFWELTQGGIRRADELWKPAHRSLTQHLNEIEYLHEKYLLEEKENRSGSHI